MHVVSRRLVPNDSKNRFLRCSMYGAHFNFLGESPSTRWSRDLWLNSDSWAKLEQFIYFTLLRLIRHAFQLRKKSLALVKRHKNQSERWRQRQASHETILKTVFRLRKETSELALSVRKKRFCRGSFASWKAAFSIFHRPGSNCNRRRCWRRGSVDDDLPFRCLEVATANRNWDPGVVKSAVETYHSKRR